MQQVEQDQFELGKRLTRGELLSNLAGKVTDAKIVICVECHQVVPILHREIEMMQLHWREWLERDGWKQRGAQKKWTCPSCLQKYKK